MGSRLSIEKFFTSLPSEDECLDNLFASRFGGKRCAKCQAWSRHYRVRGRKCYECGRCGHQVSPMKGTPMENSSTGLRVWLTAAYLISTSRNAISANEMKRRLDVGYKTAWRICHKLRECMVDEVQEPMFGTLEVDETYIGGRARKTRENYKGFNPFANKKVVLGMFCRGGEVRTFHIASASAGEIIPLVRRHAAAGSTVYSDEHAIYRQLPEMGYGHASVNHGRKEWARGDVTTNRIEGYWSCMKRSVRGTYIHFSAKHARRYLDEYEFRYNNRSLRDAAKFLLLADRMGFGLRSRFSL